MNTKLLLGSIVVGVDGSSHGLDALVWAADQAVMEHRPLVIAHATGATSRLPGTEGRAESNRQARRIAGRRTVDAAHAVAVNRAPGLRVQTICRATTPQLLLRDLACHARMVVLGSRGLGPIGSVALRSVSVAVSSAADVPVVVVRPPGNGSPARIVVGTDASASSAAAIEFAFAQASARGVPLTVTHCTSDVSLGLGTDELSADEVEHYVNERLALSESIAGLREKYVDVNVNLLLGRGPADDHLVRQSYEADLVVVGARGHHGPGASFMGSVSQRVVERAHCPVAVVHSKRVVGEGHAHPAAVEQPVSLGVTY